MLVLLVVIIATINAWFTQHKEVTAGNMTVQALSTNIDIAPCIKTYNTTTYEVLTDGPGEFTKSLTFPDDLLDDEKTILTEGNFTLTKDCTGDGLLLIVPDFNITVDYESVRKTTGKDVNLTTEARAARSQQDSWKEKKLHPNDEAPEYDYIQLEFYVRSKNPDLRLSENCQLLAKTEADNNNASVFTTPAEGSAKRSAYGNFNVDALVGAMRVSLIAEACNNVTQTWIPLSGNNYRLGTTNALQDRSSPVKQLLWVPRPDVQLNIPDTQGDISTWSLSQRQQSAWASDTNTYYQNRNDHSGVELVNDSNATTKISSGGYNGSPCLGSNVNISDFSSQTGFERQTVQLPVEAGNNDNKADYYVTKYTMKIWIEGSDFEARRAMDGGEFVLKLYFT